jgi:hypothetical protein
VTASLFAATLAANFVAAGNVLHGLLDVPLRAGILTVAVLVIVYTVLGGFSGVVGTDLDLGRCFRDDADLPFERLRVRPAEVDLTTLALVAYYGGEPAHFLDIGGGPKADG